MSKKTHYKIRGVDRRNQGQAEAEYNNQGACGFAGVTTTRIKKEVSCTLCKRAIEAAENCDDGLNYDNTM